MKNKLLTIFFGVIISLFFVNYCFAALSSPYSLNAGDPGIGSVPLSWCWGTEEEINNIDSSETEAIKYFQLSWREGGDDSEDWTLVQPSSNDGAASELCNNNSHLFTYLLVALNEGTTHEWKLVAQANDGNFDSVNAEGSDFTTIAEELGEEDWDNDDNDNDDDGNGGAITIRNLFEGIGNVQEAADAFMEFLSLTAFAVGPILIIYAAFLLLTKQGEPEAITQAKRIILLTIIALSIVLFAKGIPSVVKDLFK